MLLLIVVTQLHFTHREKWQEEKTLLPKYFPCEQNNICNLCDSASISHPTLFVNKTEDCRRKIAGSLHLHSRPQALHIPQVYFTHSVHFTNPIRIYFAVL